MTRKQPADRLGTAGRGLVDSLCGELGDDNEFDARELALIGTAAKLAGRLADLEAMIATDGLRQVTSTGSARIHPAAAEHRQTALALAKVLDAVRLPDEAASGASPASLRKSRAANVRWSTVRALHESTAAG